jgi:hypothetical protein
MEAMDAMKVGLSKKRKRRERMAMMGGKRKRTKTATPSAGGSREKRAINSQQEHILRDVGVSLRYTEQKRSGVAEAIGDALSVAMAHDRRTARS